MAGAQPQRRSAVPRRSRVLRLARARVSLACRTARLKLAPCASPAPGSICQYKVKPGDSLWLIGDRVGIPEAEMRAANPGMVPETMQVGQVVNVPFKGRCPQDSGERRPRAAEGETHAKPM